MKKHFCKKLGNKGQVLILSYMVISAFIVFTAGLLMKATSEMNMSERKKLTSETFYLAEGAAEDAMNAFATQIANFAISPGIATFNWATTFATFGNAVVNSTITRLETDDRVTVENGSNVYICNYEVTATAVHPQNSSIIVTTHQIIARRLIPTFQHAVFYNDDLEILPGASMTLSGRIHSNNDMYLDSNGNTLTIDSFYVHSAGDIYNRRKDAVGPPQGTTRIRVNSGGAPAYQNMAGLDSSSATWTADAITRWQGTVQSSVHGVTELTTPSVGSIQPNGYYANNANVVITNNTIVKNGVTLAEGVNYPVGTVTSSTTSFYSNREGKWIKMTTIDLSKLEGRTGTCGGGACPNNLPSNGLVYATRNDITGSQEPGIKLINGSEIDRANGLTIVSNAPVYIKGDYNTTNEKPTSVIADSMNLLSNNWNDANSDDPLGSRTATNTTYNCAFVSGVDTTTVGQYNGGLENYPRLHEGWSGRTLTIKGSFVELWNSSMATGAWAYGAPQYTAPNRNWQYNTDFNDPSKLSPFTPMAVEIQRVAWWTD
jgi:hypothetical protein